MAPLPRLGCSHELDVTAPALRAEVERTPGGRR